jgi:Zn/Cd-binding protein ZinT
VLAKLEKAIEHLQQPPSVQVQQPAVRPEKAAAWRLCKGSRRQVAAVLAEMKWWYTLNQKVPSGDVPINCGSRHRRIFEACTGF